MIKLKPNLGIGWVLMTFAFAVHVLDEALNDFLHIYNPVVTKMKESIPFLPVPNFTFQIWITGLIVVILILFSLTPFALRKAGWIIKLSYLYGIIMLLNGIGHALGSVALAYLMPGVYSSPLLLLTSLYLLWSANKAKATVR